MALFLYKIQPVRQGMITEGRTPEEERIVEEHFDYLERLTNEGVVHLAGRTLTEDYGGFGIIIFRAPSQAEASGLVENDPAVAGRVMRAELYPFKASLVGPMPA